MRYSANSFSRACFFSSSFLFIIPFLSFFMVFVLCGSARAVSDINYEYLKCIETAETVSKEAGAAAFHKTALKCIKSNSDPEIGASCLVRAAEIYMSINGDSQKIKDILQLVVDNYSTSSWIKRACELLTILETGSSNILPGPGPEDSGIADGAGISAGAAAFDYSRWERADAAGTPGLILYLVAKQPSHPAYPGYPNIAAAREKCTLDFNDYVEQSRRVLLSMGQDEGLDILDQNIADISDNPCVYRKIGFYKDETRILQHQYSVLFKENIYIFNLALLDSSDLKSASADNNFDSESLIREFREFVKSYNFR